MLQRFCFTLVLTLFAFSVFASFPVNATSDQETKDIQVQSISYNNMELGMAIPKADVAISPAAASADNTLIITLLLWFFLGWIAAHRWYAKKPALWNIIFILTLGGFGIWWIIDLINILTGNW